MQKFILVVEDNEPNRRLFVDVLEANGYRTLAAERGAEVLPMLRRQRPDIVLLDIGLPDMSGLDVARAIKEDPSLRDIPVVAVTAQAMPGDERRIREGGCDGYLAKPVSVASLLKAVRSFAG